MNGTKLCFYGLRNIYKLCFFGDLRFDLIGSKRFEIFDLRLVILI